MSRNNDNNLASIVTGVVVIGGALVGAGAALWQFYKQQSESSQREAPNRRSSNVGPSCVDRGVPRSSKPVELPSVNRAVPRSSNGVEPPSVNRTVPRSSSQEEPRKRTGAVDQKENSTQRFCPICVKNLEAEKSVILDCNHGFHKMCLQANIVLNYKKPEYECCVCHTPVSQEKLNEALL